MGRQATDLTGQRFGKLTVLGQSSSTYISGKNRIRWLCLCECGNQTLVQGGSLKNGRVKSCGCNQWQPQITSKERTINICWKNIKIRAGRKGLDFNLTKSNIGNLIFLPCHYCGALPTNKHDFENTIPYQGVDRINSDNGYTPDNVIPCCWECNRRKSDTPYLEFVAWVRKVTAHLGQ